MSTTALALGPSVEDRYGWPGADEGPSAGALEGTCASIARQLVRAGVRTVGFLPAAAALPDGASVAPLLSRVGRALLGFLPDDVGVGVIDTWSTWPWGPAMEPGDRSLFRTRALRPSRLIELSPVPCGDVEAALVALEGTMGSRPPGLAMVLVNLAGYAAPGATPAATGVLDGVVLLAGRRRSWGALVERMARSLPAKKNLGTILVD